MTPNQHQDHALKGALRVVRYGTEYRGHDVEVEFDRRKLVVNAARLRLDGELVDQARVFYGEKELRASLGDGGELIVVVDSGMAGELTRLQLKGDDGAWIDLVERGTS
jgi:hypothetical protein